jgi:hypothetical protein
MPALKRFKIRMKQLYLVLLLLPLVAGAQPVPTLSDSARISLITVAPGEELYSTFGHSALRVRDPQNRIDRCYNYGTFDFEQPNFLMKFLRGRLLYFLNVERYRDFEASNLYELRPMREQMLAVDATQRQRLFELLQTNARPENREYKYDFFYDNCATRIRDVVQETFFYQLQWDSTVLPPGRTMRQLLRPYLLEKPWTQFGIDLLIGLPADRRALATDYMFLPDHMHDLFGAARIDASTPLVRSEHTIPEHGLPREPYQAGLLDRPLWVMLFVAALGVASLFNARAERIFDTIFWFVIGLAGVVIAFLWFFTDHAATKTNFNLFWALPTHLLVFWRRRRSGWLENYFVGTSVLAFVLLVFWAWMPQEMPPAAVPIVALIAVKGVVRRWRNAREDEREEARLEITEVGN